MQLRKIIGWTILVLVVGFGVVLIAPKVNAAREHANRAECARHLRVIFGAIVAYGNQNGDRLPPNAEAFASHLSDAGAWACPSCKPSGSASSSYIYLGGALGNYMNRVENPQQTVLLYELPSNHGGDGFNVIFASGQGAWIPAWEAKNVLARIEKLQAKGAVVSGN